MATPEDEIVKKGTRYGPADQPEVPGAYESESDLSSLQRVSSDLTTSEDSSTLGADPGFFGSDGNDLDTLKNIIDGDAKTKWGVISPPPSLGGLGENLPRLPKNKEKTFIIYSRNLNRYAGPIWSIRI